jgi:streptogramin lyase
MFARPDGITADSNGNVFVADRNNRLIRKIVVSTGAVSTLAGGGSVGGTASGSADGTGVAATFYNPYGVVADNSGNVFVADTYNNLIRKIVVSTGAVSTLAGGGSVGGTASGSADGTGVAAMFWAPTGVAADNSGNVFVADRNNNRIRKIVVSTGAVTTLAGGGSVGGTASGSADGTGVAAMFFGPSGVATDNNGNVFVADTNNNLIRKIVVSTGAVTTLAGGGSVGGVASGRADGTGAAAMFKSPYGVAVGSNGNVFVSDEDNHVIRVLA